MKRQEDNIKLLASLEVCIQSFSENYIKMLLDVLKFI